MNIALIGGTGFVGSAVLNELLDRGHAVTALARNPARYADRQGLRVVTADACNVDQVAAAVRSHDAVVSAYNPGWSEPDLHARFLAGHRAIVQGVRQAGLRRLLVVGGAGSLYVAPGVQLVDTPAFPAEWKQGALGARDALQELQGDTTLDWTFVSPPVHLEPGQRTGQFRWGRDEVLMSGEQPARISVADLAVAIADELERPAHVQARFTVGY